MCTCLRATLKRWDWAGNEASCNLIVGVFMAMVGWYRSSVAVVDLNGLIFIKNVLVSHLVSWGAGLSIDIEYFQLEIL